MRSFTKTELELLMESTGIESAYREFTENTAVPPPFICFYLTESDDQMADNQNYVKIRDLVVELYTDTKDYELEKTVEAVLTSAGIAFSITESYIDSERMNMVAYSAQIIFKEEAQNG